MHKIKDKIKYNRNQRQRAYRELRGRKHYQLWRKKRNIAELGVAKETLKTRYQNEHIKWRYIDVFAPNNLSFVENTEDVVNFIKNIESLREKKKWVFVKLRKIENIDYGAIVALLSIVVTFKANSLQINGDFPRNSKARNLLLGSGFFESLAGTFLDEERYEIARKGCDGIHTHAYKKVDSELSANIIKSASVELWNEERRCQGVQRSLIELMHNTNNHAEIGKKGEKHWWLSVRYDKENQKVCFAFVDFGVGIFKSLESKSSDSKWFGWPQKITKRIKYGDNSDILRLIMKGQFHEIVTGCYFRGKGLPGIAEAQMRNQISNLKIVTNDVYCSFDDSDYRRMRTDFNGTFVYWELNKNNGSWKNN